MHYGTSYCHSLGHHTFQALMREQIEMHVLVLSEVIMKASTLTGHLIDIPVL